MIAPTDDNLMTLKIKIWRQADNASSGSFETHEMTGVNPDMSILELLDVLNEKLMLEGKEPIAFDHDCREGICGTCGFMINGQAHGPLKNSPTCQLRMRWFKDGDNLTLEPFRAKAFPVVKDLVIDRSAFDRIQHSGGYISVSTGNAPDANSLPVPKVTAEKAMSAAACIGCGACVASCKNASASLFTGAKVSHFAYLPQGKGERQRRVLSMVAQMDEEGFGACTNTLECQAACPAGISVQEIAKMNREYLAATLTTDD
ncbi:succinate dehydrogenase/fumarate reductase iron-sulfur subunit [Calycomorphotria hydatis]|uniref:Fumarate reductase iron-sulfur subunit n=1 Tax=Calycomorphotria hydatis TaxID=2528027 RepID=A0A517TDX7_9PLAN|nr:succinate dehydrogenase/fumarate reductase iron-sulfur subunit [Calycomorphotria hydatis]QDT66577.1 Fumarate reductase iron-sulfur subunit [Calycomorphotria hydatis]